MAPRSRSVRVVIDTSPIADMVGDRFESWLEKMRDAAFGQQQQQAQQQQQRLPPGAAPLMFKCVGHCGPNNTYKAYPLAEMQQLDPHPDHQGWGTCRNCYAFFWNAAKEKRHAILEQVAKQAAARAAGGRAAPPPAAAPPPPRRKSAWAVLELPLDGSATDGEVKKAYFRLAAMHHPDSCPPGTPTDEVYATKERFLEIQRAYEVIKRIRAAAT